MGREKTSRGELAVSAQNISFDSKKLRLQAGAETVIHFENRDSSSILHNVAIYQDAEANDPIFQGKIIPGGTDIDYEFTAPGSGEYFFRCDVHSSMNGTVVVERWKDGRWVGSRLVDRSVGDTEPIGSYGLLADCNTAALISRNGSIRPAICLATFRRLSATWAW